MNSPVKSRVLFVDDDPDTREVLSDYLKDLHYEVALSQNGREAQAMIRDYKPDVIVSDIWMPDLDGIGLCESLRKEGINTPFIFITGSLQKQQIEACKQLGAVEFVQKPFYTGKLDAALLRVLANAAIKQP